MILGIDVGYSHVKVYGEGLEFNFKSTISEETSDIIGSIKVEYLDKEYTIGENKGFYDTEVNKIESNTFKVLFYTAIAKAMGDSTVEDIKVVTGLPAQYYQSQKGKLIDKYKGQKVTMVVNGIPKRFTISDIIVFPQSTGILITNPNLLVGDVAIVDIGGFTVDLSFFSNKNLVKLDTLELGMNILANELVQKIKSEYNVSYDVLKVDDILDRKSIIKDGIELKIDDLIDNVLKTHTNLILNRLKGISEYNISKHVFVGGGAYRLQTYIEELQGDVNKDTIFTNAKAFYRIGVEKFGNKED